MKLTIKDIVRANKHSEAKNKDYVSVIITGTDDKKYSGFGNKVNEHWIIGQEVEVDVTVNGKYNNFELPNRKVDSSSLLEEVSKKFAEIDNRLKDIERDLQEIQESKDFPNVADTTDKVTQDENLPF